MTKTDLTHLPGRFVRSILLGFLFTPIIGLGTAFLYGLFPAETIAGVVRDGWFPLFGLVMLGWTYRHFSRFLTPLLDWIDQHPDSNLAPPLIHRKMERFSRDFWGLFLLYALAAPSVVFFSPSVGGMHGGVSSYLLFLTLQLSVSVLAGLPAYLLAIDAIGSLVPRTGLPQVMVSLRAKIALLGGFVPLLAFSLLLLHRWHEMGSLSVPLLMIWMALAGVTTSITRIASRSIRRSLSAVQQTLGRSGASTHSELAALKGTSTDEIGYLTQTLGKVFQRLSDQEVQMRSVVDTAAEGILVIDDQGMIETFNTAAERLFGFLGSEVRGKSVAPLLPQFADMADLEAGIGKEQESEGRHRNGSKLPVSVRVNEIAVRGHRMFTCMVSDLSKRKAAEEQLRSAEARYRDLVETAHDLVWSVDRHGCWTYLNGACLSIYGYTPAEMIGRPMSEVGVAGHVEDDARALADVVRNGSELVQHETVHRDRNGTLRHLSFNGRAYRNALGEVEHISGTARDITEQKAFQEQLAFQAEHDALTGLFNRRYFQQELERTVARVARKGTECAVLYIDLDQFKYINDTLGHAAGDQLLVEVSALLTTHVREGDLLARFGGDEFTLLLYNINRSNVGKVAEHFRQLLEQHVFIYEAKKLNITSSMGIALIDEEVTSADEVLSHADLACNIAKTQGRNRVHIYDNLDERKAGMAADMGWAARVREMLEQDRFQLVYQPIVSVDSGVVKNYEVLVRMVCDDGSLILPGGFMPAAERFGLVHSVDRWIVQRAIEQLATLRGQGMQVCFSINLSGKAFEDKLLLPLIQQLLLEHELNPQWLTFEITETAAIANLGQAEKFIRALKDIGCQFALDDFGSGFCSFTYLKHLPVDKLKIDGTFVQNLAETSVDQAMVQSMNQIAHALGKQTVAEYVETEATLQLLREYGVDYAQGNFIGVPRDALLSLAPPAPASDTKTSSKCV